MFMFHSLVVALLAISGSLASPTHPIQKYVTKRGSPDFILGPHNHVRRQSTDYTQDYTTGGSVSFSPNGNSFSVTFDTTQDFVVGRGWQTGTTTPINLDGTFSVSSGVGLLSVYGWTTNPLVEYYIIEDSSNPPQQGSVKGTFTSDGSTYTVWENQRVQEPSIQGTATFNQYISIRSSGRSSGTVTLENHFKQWASYGLNLGTFNYQVVAVESWSGAGSAQQTVAKGNSTA